MSREKDTTDARVTRVKATPKFLALGHDVRNVWARLDSETTDGLSSVERSQLAALLGKIATNLRELGSRPTSEDAQTRDKRR